MYLGESLCQHRLQLPTGRCQPDPLWHSDEKLNAQMILKQFDVSADCAARDMKLVARSDETPVARGGLEGPEGVEGRHPVHDVGSAFLALWAP